NGIPIGGQGLPGCQPGGIMPQGNARAASTRAARNSAATLHVRASGVLRNSENIAFEALDTAAILACRLAGAGVHGRIHGLALLGQLLTPGAALRCLLVE